MANPWFRLYSEFADDPKVQMMPEPMQRRLVMLMCSHCKNETLHETHRAFHWRVTPAELAETKALFVENGFIDDDWTLLNWSKRQYVSDSSNERVARHRQAKKQDVTLHVTHETRKPVTVTPPDTDTEAEAEEKTPPPISSEMIAAAVLQDLGLAGKWLLDTLAKVATAELAAGADPTKLRDELIAAWRAYPEGEFRKKPENFFGDGDWRKHRPKPKRPDALAEQKAYRAQLEADERARGLR